MRIDGMCELLRRMLDGAGEYFTNDKLTKERRAKYLEHVEKLLIGFHDYFEEFVEVCRLKIPLDPVKVGPILEAYRNALAPLRAFIKDGKGKAMKVRAFSRRGGMMALGLLPDLLRNRKSAYSTVNELSTQFTFLLSLVESRATSEELVKALEKHDEFLLEFQKLSGLE